MAELLEAIELETGPQPRTAVIWMHGLGADGHDFEPVVPHLSLPETVPVRFVFPHAPYRSVTVNRGFVMRAWYDVYDVPDAGGGRPEDAEGVRGSQAQIEALIARERARGIPAGRLLLAGFSRGGAMALHTGLRHPERLAGIIALSCHLPLPGTLAAEGSPANRDVPIFMAHGTDDEIIPLSRACQSRDRLLDLGYRVTWHEYPMSHAVSAEEILDLAAWLREVLGPRA